MERDWELGFMIAKNVSLGSGTGRRTDLGNNKRSTGKISAREFQNSSKLISDKTVSKYLKTWNRAAMDGLVPYSEDLSPLSNIVFEDELHTPELWNEYYNGGSEPCVYIIGHKYNSDWPVKIGKANDVESRLGLLQCGTPWELEVLFTIPGGYKEEAGLHQRFANKLVRGEWYSLTQEDLKELEEM